MDARRRFCHRSPLTPHTRYSSVDLIRKIYRGGVEVNQLYESHCAARPVAAPSPPRTRSPSLPAGKQVRYQVPCDAQAQLRHTAGNQVPRSSFTSRALQPYSTCALLPAAIQLELPSPLYASTQAQLLSSFVTSLDRISNPFAMSLRQQCSLSA